VIHEGQQWYLEPGASLCTRHIAQVTIDRNEVRGYDATIAVTGEGRRTMAQMTRVPGEHFGILVFGSIHSIPQVASPIDSDSAKITVSEGQLSVWQRVANSVGRR
jgi:preprotein translocase subunit SecD